MVRESDPGAPPSLKQNKIKTKPNKTKGVDQTVSLLHMDGADGGTVFTDEKGKIWSRVNNVQTVVALKKFGTASMYAGSTDYLTTPAHIDFAFGTGDFTLELWWYASSVESIGTIFRQYQDANNLLLIQHNNAGNLSFIYKIGGVTLAYYYTGNSIVAAGQFYHLAFVRNGNTFKIFVNGVSKALTENTAIAGKDLTQLNAVFGIGGAGASARYDEVRISKGIARFTSDFAVPTAAY